MHVAYLAVICSQDPVSHSLPAKSWKNVNVKQFVLHAHTHVFPEMEKSQPSHGGTDCPGSPTRVPVHCQVCQAAKCTIFLLTWVVLSKTFDNYFFVDLPPLPHIKMRGFSGWYTFVLISRASQHHYSFLGKDGALLWDEGWSLFLVLSSVTDE